MLNDFIRVKYKINNLPYYSFAYCNRPNIKVACILDTFSYECFKYECSLEQLKLETWKLQMQRLKPLFLFVESAWGGVDNSWRFILTKKADASRRELLDLIRYCKNNKIITVFWNKEDPVYYANLIDIAKLFDYIFTTDENCAVKYIGDTRHKRVHTLPFAAQPAIHNPVRLRRIKKENVAFAGTWYAVKHIERQEDMHIVLNPAKEFGLHIFDRMNTFKGNDYKFPLQYQSHIIGELNYYDMLKAYKLYKVFLNVNSVKNSPTMFSRRVFEVLASGTNLVTTYSKGIKEMFGDIVAFTASMEETRVKLAILLNNPEHSERLSLLGIREVHAKHLYWHRFNTILEKIGFEPLAKNELGVSIICYLKEGQSVQMLLETFQSQTVKNKELIIVSKRSSIEWNDERNSYSNVTTFFLPECETIVNCLDFVLKKIKNGYITLFDMDNYYGPNFLKDLMNAFSYTNADIIGKGTYYTYCEDKRLLVLKSPNLENKFVTLVQSSAMIIKRTILHNVLLQELELESFLETCVNRGVLIYSADKYNFIKRMKNCNKESQDKFIAYTDDDKSYVTI